MESTYIMSDHIYSSSILTSPQHTGVVTKRPTRLLRPTHVWFAHTHTPTPSAQVSGPEGPLLQARSRTLRQRGRPLCGFERLATHTVPVLDGKYLYYV